MGGIFAAQKPKRFVFAFSRGFVAELCNNDIKSSEITTKENDLKNEVERIQGGILVQYFEYDVVIMGGGTAGVLAALASARSGAKTVIIEQTGSLGGSSSNGMPWGGMFDSEHRQIIFGIPDELVKKAVELGVYEIIPFSSSRCVVKLDGKSAAKKTERWQKIAHSAAKQSGRGIIPQVREPIPFGELIKKADDFDLSLICYECEEDNSLKSVLSANKFKNACIVVGPEGGFDRVEVDRALENGFTSVSLGKRILRCETAPGCAICAMLYHTDNM